MTDSATIECLDGASRLQVEWSSGARGEWPLTVCDVGCAPWALPDLDGDGDQELLIESAIEAEGIDGAYVTIFDMYPSEATGTPLSIVGGELGGVPQGTLPGFPVGEPAVFPIGDSEGSSSALSCSAPRLSWERSTLEDDGSWTVRTVVVGVHAGRQSAKARAEALSETVVPGASGPGRAGARALRLARGSAGTDRWSLTHRWEVNARTSSLSRSMPRSVGTSVPSSSSSRPLCTNGAATASSIQLDGMPSSIRMRRNTSSR